MRTLNIALEDSAQVKLARSLFSFDSAVDKHNKHNKHILNKCKHFDF